VAGFFFAGTVPAGTKMVKAIGNYGPIVKAMPARSPWPLGPWSVARVPYRLDHGPRALELVPAGRRPAAQVVPWTVVLEPWTW